MNKERGIINLTNLTIENSCLLDQVSKDVIPYINDFSEEIIKKSNASLAALFSIIASRHSYQNKLFYSLSYLLLIQKIVEREKSLKKIIVPDKILLKPALLYLKNRNIDVVVDEDANLKEKAKNYFTQILSIFDIFSLSIKFILSKSRKRIIDFKKKKQIILIDTFFLKNTLQKQKYTDRYYTGMYDFVPEKLKQKIFFIPTILGEFNKNKLNHIFNNSNENILYKHDFLKIKDYIISFKLLAGFELPRKTFLFSGFDITSIVKIEFRRTKFNLSSFRAFLDYYFFKNLKKQKIDVKLLIDWNENQVVDKAIIKGFKEFYPRSYVKGYQGFITSNDFHFYIPPTFYEVKNEVIADEICVTGAALRENIKRFYNKIKITIAPSFRFTRRKNNLINELPPEDVLLILPIRIEESVLIAQMFKLALDEMEENEIEINIKSHPATNITKLTLELDRIFNAKYNFINDSIIEIVKDYKVVMGSASTALFEAICYGVPVIIIANNSGITQNPIPESIDKSFWKLCYSSKELMNAVEDFLYLTKNKRTKLAELANQLQEEYFEEINEESVLKFLSNK